MYEVLLRSQPEKYLRKLNEKTRNLFKIVFERLEQDPLRISAALHGELDGLHRVRVRKLRMVILIDRVRGKVEVLEIGPRGDIY